jgi:hypothetical protein
MTNLLVGQLIKILSSQLINNVFNLKTDVFWDVALCRLVKVNRRFRSMSHEDGGSNSRTMTTNSLSITWTVVILHYFLMRYLISYYTESHFNSLLNDV